MKTLLDDAGRIQLPDRLQAKWGVQAGDELAWKEENGRWFLEPAVSRPIGSEQSAASRGIPCPASLRECTITASPAADSDHEDLNWEDLDYEPLSLRHAGQVCFRIHRRGKLQPLPHNLDEE